MAVKTVTGKVTGPDNAGKAASITIALSQATIITATQEIVPSVIKATAAADGTYSVSLQANNDMTPTGTYYTVTESALDGGFYTFTIVVPQTAGPFVMTSIQTSPPQLGNTPTHVSTMTVDGLAAVGSLTVTAGETGIDTAAAGVLEIGGDNATSVEIGPANVLVDASGNVAARSFTAGNSPNTPNSSNPNGITSQNRFITARTGGRTYGLGDSIMIAGDDWPGPNWAQGYGFLSIACRLSGQRMMFTGVNGVAGYTTSDMLNTLLPQVLALSPLPDRVMVLGGTNDTGNGVTIGPVTTVGTILYNLATIYQKLRAAGIEPIAATIPPNSYGVAQRDKDTLTLNVGIRRLANRFGIAMADFYAACTDVTTGQWRAGYNVDNAHPNGTGAAAMAAAMPNIWSLYPMAGPYLTSWTADPINMLVNGTFAGAGPVATSWAVGTVGTGVTDSTIAGGTIPGQRQRTVKTTDDLHQIQQNVAGGLWSVGDTLAFSCVVSTSGVGTMQPRILLNFIGSGGGMSVLTNTGSPSKSPTVDLTDAVCYGEVVIPAGTTQVRLVLETYHPGTLDVGQATLINLTTAGALLSSLTPTNGL